MPTKKPVAKSSKASKPVATSKPAARKPVARSSSSHASAHTAAKSKASAAKAPTRKAAADSKDSVPKTPAKAAPAKPATAAPASVARPAAKTAAKAAPKAGAETPKAAATVVTAVAVRTSLVPPRTDANLTATTVDGDEGEDGHNLLAGPRNVKPYIVKRGEQYMNKEQTEHFRKILLAWKRDLMVEVDRTVSHMKDEAANFPDPNDRATQEEEFSLELRTRDRERKLIRKIDEAIKRIEDGSYGYCLETGEEIGVKRLEARPVATLSLEAQERRERREKQYGDRDDRYR